MTDTTGKIPAWKQFEDNKLEQKTQEEEIRVASDIISYLKMNNIEYECSNFKTMEHSKTIKGQYEGSLDWFIKIKLEKLLSKKEILKLLEMVDDKLGFQIIGNKIEIYKLFSKIPRK